MQAPLPENETQRLKRLGEYAILDTPSEPAFEDITRIAALSCGVSVAQVTLVDGEREWVKAGGNGSETPREWSLCAHAILHSGLTVVPDLRRDPRFADHPLAMVGDASARFYAAAPLVTPDGYALGTVNLLHDVPHDLSAAQRATLESLAAQVVSLLELRRLTVERERVLAGWERDAAALWEAQQRLSQALAAGQMGTWDWRHGSDGSTWSDSMFLLHELLPGSVGPTLDDYLRTVYPEDREAVLTAVLHALEVGGAYHCRYRVPLQSGRMCWLEGRGQAVRDPSGQVIGMMGTCQDVTAYVLAQEAAEWGRRQLQAITDNVPALIGRVNAERRYVFCNQYYHDYLGLETDQIIGKTLWEVLGEEAYTAMRPYVDRVLAGERVTYETKLFYQRREWRSVLLSYVPEFGEHGAVTGYLLSAIDISARKALEEERERRLARTHRQLAEAQEQADRDPVTGLLNHRAFHKRLSDEANRALRDGVPLTVAMLDLDNFKFFNDAYGHLAGDDVLRRVAAALKRRCRGYDVLARFGGDEFALLMPGVGAADAARTAARLRAGIARLGYRPPGHNAEVPLSLSVGMAVFPDDAATRLDVVAVADARLYRAKTGAGDGGQAERLRALLSRSVEGFSMLDALVVAVDNKDRYTRRHSEDVLLYCLEIAQALGLDEETQHTVAVAALLHDVGKIGVPDHILRKPGALTEEEFVAVRHHPQMGAVMVGAVPGLGGTLGAVRHHHERWDGGGYPDGLCGEQIPLLARLMAVADAYSAMTTDRPYRKGLGGEHARGVLRSGAGTQWDPQCVQAFLTAASHCPAVPTTGSGCPRPPRRRKLCVASKSEDN